METKRYTISVITLGCRVNQYESLAFTEGLQKYGIDVVRPGEPCDAAIVNTCTVTAESDRKSRQMIRRAASYAGHVIVTGCFAQISADTAAAIDNVTYVCGNGGKATLADTVYAILTGTYTGEKSNVGEPDGYDAVEMTTTLPPPERARSYIKIEDGCENRCAYCIIPKARGPVRSKKPETVLSEAKALAASGCREIILTGIETASYGMDFEGKQPYGHRLAELIGDIAAVDGIERIGLGSLEPTVMSDYFVGKLAAESKILPHFHLSIQSGCNRTLAEMKRRYNADMAIAAIHRMRGAMPDVTFSADVIVGFPGETEEDFSETMEFCREARFLHTHIFPYSKRAGTVAAERKDQVPDNVKHDRLVRLETLVKSIKREMLDDYVENHRDTPVYVLVEKSGNGGAFGHSEHYYEVEIPGCTAEAGDILAVRLDSHDGETVTGHIK